MARNAIESDFRASKMDAGGHFVKNKLPGIHDVTNSVLFNVFHVNISGI